jgi:hypothetical protein
MSMPVRARSALKTTARASMIRFSGVALQSTITSCSDGERKGDTCGEAMFHGDHSGFAALHGLRCRVTAAF